MQRLKGMCVCVVVFWFGLLFWVVVFVRQYNQSTFWVKNPFQATNTNTYMTSKWCEIRMKTAQNVVMNRACKEQIQTKSNGDCCNSQKPYSAKLISAFPCGLHDMKMRCLITSQHRSRWIAFLSEKEKKLRKKPTQIWRKKNLRKTKSGGKKTTNLLEEKTHKEHTQIWKYFHRKNIWYLLASPNRKAKPTKS